MEKSTAVKLFSGLVATGGIGVATAYGIYEFNRKTIENKLEGTLLTKQEADNDKWKNRATTLKEDNSKLSEGLQKIKNGKDDGSDIQAWCDSNLKAKFTSEQDQLFKEIQKYCVYNIKEKATGVADISKWEESKHNKKLKDNTTNVTLSPTMQKVKNDLTKSNSPDKDALKKWCEATYKNPFKGETDQDYLDAKEYCVSTQ